MPDKNNKKRPRFRREEFWMDDYKELYQNGNYIRFFPKYKTSRIEQLNAITRFCMYLILLILMFNKNEQWLYLPITLIVMIVILYNINKNDETWREKELDKILSIRKTERDDKREEVEKQLKHDGEKTYKLDIDTEEEYDQNYDLEAGYIDADGNIIAGEKTKPPKYRKNEEESLFTVNEIEEFKRNTCRKPTKDNPFMNPAIVDYNTENPPAACNINDEYINDSIQVNFNHELFRDVDELWERKNSQRQFYTIPNTAIPNNQTEFANWLYKVEDTCKENTVKCLRYENLASNRYPDGV